MPNFKRKERERFINESKLAKGERVKVIPENLSSKSQLMRQNIYQEIIRQIMRMKKRLFLIEGISLYGCIRGSMHYDLYERKIQ